MISTNTDSYSCLYLSSEGDSLLINHINTNNPPGKQVITEDPGCKTHVQVLTYLTELQKSETKNHLNFRHDNNCHYQRYGGVSIKPANHHCSLEEQINFVQYKIGEKTYGVRETRQGFFYFLALKANTV